MQRSTQICLLKNKIRQARNNVLQAMKDAQERKKNKAKAEMSRVSELKAGWRKKKLLDDWKDRGSIKPLSVLSFKGAVHKVKENRRTVKLFQDDGAQVRNRMCCVFSAAVRMSSSKLRCAVDMEVHRFPYRTETLHRDIQ